MDGGTAGRPGRRPGPGLGGGRVGGAGRGGAFAESSLRRNQVLDPASLLALRVTGVDLSLDHGFPARVIVPANPGVHNTT